MRLLSKDEYGGGSTGSPLEQPKPLNPPAENPEMQRLQQDLIKLGHTAGDVIKRLDELGRPANILITGPSASKKSTLVGILRFLIESSGYATEKVKEGKLSTLVSPKGEHNFKEHAPGTRVILWESTITLPLLMDKIDLYVELRGDVWARVDRLAKKTGSYEFAQLVGSAPQNAQRKPGREPDFVINTDPITIQLEHSGWVTTQIEEGWRQSLAGTQISTPTHEENQPFQLKIKTLNDLGLGRYLNPNQISFLAVRLRQDSLKTTPDGRNAIYIPRINLILGETVTSKIPLEQLEIPHETDRYYMISDNPQNQKMDTIPHPNTWLTTKPQS